MLPVFPVSGLKQTRGWFSTQDFTSTTKEGESSAKAQHQLYCVTNITFKPWSSCAQFNTFKVNSISLHEYKHKEDRLSLIPGEFTDGLETH